MSHGLGARNRLYRLLRWSERYTKTDMVYLFSSGVWLNAGSMLVTVCSFLLYIVFANALPKEIYGTYQYLLSVSAIIGALTLTGMNAAVTRAVAQGHEGTLIASVRVQLRWAAIPLVVAALGSAYYFINGNQLLGWGLLAIGITTPLLNAFNTYGMLFAGRKDFRKGFYYFAATSIPYYAAVAAMAYLWPAVLPLLLVNLAVQLGATFMAYRATLRRERPNTSIDPAAISYGKHLSLMGLVGVVAGQADNILAFQQLGAVELALYSFATAIPERLANLLKFIPLAALPKFAERTLEEIRSSIWGKLLKALVPAALLAGAYMFAAPYVFSFLFPAYAEAVPYSQVFALIIITSMGGVLSTALVSQRHVRELYVFNTLTPIVQLVLLVAGVFLWGLWGLIAAKLTSNAFSALLAAILLIRKRPSQ